MPEIILKCLVVGESPDSDVFKIKIDNSDEVAELRGRIWDEKQGVFANVRSQLKLWKVDICSGDEEKLNILRYGNRIRIENDLDGTELLPKEYISRYFHQAGSRQPNEKHINIVVRGKLD